MKSSAENIELLASYIVGQKLLEKSQHVIHGELEDVGWSQDLIHNAFAISAYTHRFYQNSNELEREQVEKKLNEYKALPLPLPENTI